VTVAHSPRPPATRSYVQILSFRDGKFYESNLTYDRLLLLEQLGLMPAAATG
jgi:hypothetical protein